MLKKSFCVLMIVFPVDQNPGDILDSNAYFPLKINKMSRGCAQGLEYAQILVSMHSRTRAPELKQTLRVNCITE